MLPSLEMTPQLSFLVTRSSKLSQEVWRGMRVGLGLGLGAGLWLEGNHASDIRKQDILDNDNQLSYNKKYHQIKANTSFGVN